MKKTGVHNGHGRELLIRGLIPLIALALLAVLIAGIQTGFVWRSYDSLADSAMAIAEQRMEKNRQESENDWATFHGYAQARVDLITYMLKNRADPTGGMPLEEIAAEFELDELYYITPSGNRVSATGSTLPENIRAAFEEDNGHAYALIGDVCYYYAPIGRGYIVAGENIAEMVQVENELVSVGNALHDIHVGVNGYVCALSREGEYFRIAYTPEGSAIGETGEILKSNEEDYPISENGSMYELNGSRYFMTYHFAEGDEYVLITIVPESELASVIRVPVIIALALFAGIAVLMLAYMRYIGDDIKNGRVPDTSRVVKVGKKHKLNVAILEKTRILLALALIAVMVITFYSQALVLMDHQKNISRVKLDTVSEELISDVNREDDIRAAFDKEYTALAKEIAYTFKLNPSLVNNAAVSEIAHLTGVNTIFVFNSEGATEATSTVYVDMTVDNSQTEFWNVIKGYSDTVIRHPSNDGELEYIGVNRLDANGMVQVGMNTESMLNRMADYRLNTVLNRLSAEEANTFFFAIDRNTNKYLAWPQSRMIGTEASLELSSSTLGSSGLSYLSIDGSNYLVYGTDYANSGSNYFVYGRDISASTGGTVDSDMGSGELTVYAAASSRAILRQSVIVGGVVTAASLLVILILMLMMVIRRDDEQSEPEAAPESGNAGGSAYYAAPMGERSQNTQSAASRWDGSRLRWRDRDAESKIRAIAARLAVLAVVALMLAVYGHLADSSSIISFIISKKWQHTLNLFSISYVIFLFIQIEVLSAIVRRLLRLFTYNRGSRAETVGRLLDNFVKYATVIFLVFYAMQFIGIHTTAILASAGLLSLALSLGAQSLVADVFAGVFIVFEGEFRVGDIVTIDGYRGTVQEIGIRTTKVESAGKDIKIYRNSQISGVINMTKQYSAAVVSFDIDYRESVERVERVLDRELPKLRAKYPQCIDDPVYVGVDELGASGITLKVVVHCLEKDRIAVMRALNREMKIICDRNNICIPFPQVVVNTGSQEPQVFIRDEEEKPEE